MSSVWWNETQPNSFIPGFQPNSFQTFYQLSINLVMTEEQLLKTVWWKNTQPSYNQLTNFDEKGN